MPADHWDGGPQQHHVGPRDGAAGSHVVIETDPTPPVPYFSWFVGPILRSADKRARYHEALVRLFQALPTER